jgi:MmgE/PrpD N-terminal domain
VSATPGATVFCSSIRTSHELAVFANGVMIRYLDFNDGCITPKGGGHPRDTLAALFSSAEIAGRSGRARLCPEGKVRGRRLGKLWYVDTESFADFVRGQARAPLLSPPHQGHQ